jgi:hypothetical protein
VFPNGTAYRASIEITGAERYEFSDVGILGEQVPLNIGNVDLSGNCSPCRYNWTVPALLSNKKEITFERGNYTVSYTAPIRDNHLQGSFKALYRVNVTLPKEFDVRNPLLSGISSGGTFSRHEDNTTTVQWNRTASFDLRFYDPGREELLFFFLQILAIIAVVMLLPFLFSRQKSG